MFTENLVKVEVGPIEDDANLSDNDNHLSEDFSSPEFDIKTESPEEPKSKKRTKGVSTRAKKPKLEDAESSTKHKRVTRRKGQSTTSDDKLTLDKKLNFSTFIVIKPTGNRINSNRVTSSRAAKQQDKVVQRRLTELDLHFDNIKTVLRCSNATPIRCKVGDRYACGYCLDQYIDPRELKTHTIKKHSDNDDRPECLSIRSLSKYSVDLDITGLKCELCKENLDKLEDLIEHLKSEHDELIHSNIRNLIVPYKFESMQIKCVTCVKEFEDFNDLKEHMSEHYRNYVCEFCDKAFVIRSTMIEHKKVVHRV